MLRQRRADGAAEMRPALAPIDARPAKSAALADIGEFEPEFSKELRAFFGDGASIFVEQHIFSSNETFGQRDAEPTGKVVIASPCRT